MAGSRIKGITVEISGDTTKLHSALKGVNSEIKNTQSQLKDVEKLLKLDPGNTELLAQKQKLLSSAVSETKESSLLSRLLQNWQIRHLRMVTFPKNSIGDYIILICYYLKLLKVSKTEIKSFIREFEKITREYESSVTPNVSAITIHIKFLNSTNWKLLHLKNGISPS